MAWGNFITLPCPYKKWDGQLKNMMLAFLPSVGLVIGVLWMAIFWLLVYLQLPPILISFTMLFYIFAVCGFMHMDGFMDCNDAILSRRPLEERQRILKRFNGRRLCSSDSGVPAAGLVCKCAGGHLSHYLCGSSDSASSQQRCRGNERSDLQAHRTQSVCRGL